jgi:hypothetical protein
MHAGIIDEQLSSVERLVLDGVKEGAAPPLTLVSLRGRTCNTLANQQSVRPFTARSGLPYRWNKRDVAGRGRYSNDSPRFSVFERR